MENSAEVIALLSFSYALTLQRDVLFSCIAKKDTPQCMVNLYWE